jgi:hypothetical protein
LWPAPFDECLVSDFVQPWKLFVLLLLVVLASLPLRGMVGLLALVGEAELLTVLARISGTIAP